MGTVDIERWSKMPLVEQMTNIGSEVGRTRDLFTESYLSSDCRTLTYLDKYFGQFALAIRR